MPVPLTSDLPVEMCDGYETTPALVTELRDGDYVLLAMDVDDSDDPLLIPADHDNPVLWRFHAALERTAIDAALLEFDGPSATDGVLETLTLDVLDIAQIRLVLPGALHERWSR